jgi:DNA primase
VGRIPEETIEAIRNRVDLVDLVGRYVSLRQAGRSFKGLCPFHDEKTPSFQVNPQLGIFHCFGCNAGGNAFAFLMRHDNLTFPEAVRALGRECGIEVPETGGDGGEGIGRRLREANALAERFYRSALQGAEGAAARAYLEQRGIDSVAAARFAIGFAPEGWDALSRALSQARIPAELGARAGLLAERKSGGHYDRLRGRVTFPIRDVRGDVIGFGGRALRADQEPKYLNTPESPLFRKREAFYGLPDALEPMRRSGRAVVVEGYFDRIALARAGIAESLATCGTALSEDHARALRRRTREVVLLFDGDEAGQRAVERSLALLLPEGLRVRAVELPAGEDPDSFLAHQGAEALRALVDAAEPAIEGAIRRSVARGCATPWQKADAVAALVPLLVRVADPIERGEHVRQLAFAVGLPAADVEAAVRKERSGAERSDRDDVQERTQSGPRVEATEARWARSLARLLLDHPQLARALDRAELAELLPSPPWDRVLPALAEACAAQGSVAVAELAERLGGGAASELMALAVEDKPALEPPQAERAIGDTLVRLRQRRLAAQRRATTRRFREEGRVDIDLKQREIEESKRVTGLAPGPARV